LLIALINACTTALIAAALWLHRYDTRRGRRPVMSSLLGALVIALGVQIMVGVIGAVVGELLVGVVLLAAISIVLLLYVRVVIHDALLVEGAEHGVGPEAPGPECHGMVPPRAFCPRCGGAGAAGPKQGRARLAVGGIAIAQLAGGKLAPCTVNCAPKIVTALPEEASYRSSAFNFQVNYSSAWTVRDQDASSVTLGTHVGSVQVVGARGGTPDQAA